MNEEMRKEFEELVVSSDLIPDLFSEFGMYANRAKIVADCFCDGRYHNDFLQSSFDAFNLGWKASRQTMKPIEFPAEIELDLIGDQVAPTHQNSYAEGYNDALSDLELKITELGYKVEG